MLTGCLSQPTSRHRSPRAREAAKDQRSGCVLIEIVDTGQRNIGCTADVLLGELARAPDVAQHGTVFHHGTGVFCGLPNPFIATRYHSLVIERSTLPDCLEITAWTEDGEIMGIRHKTLAVEGVQFHPESILSEHGHLLLKNFLEQHQNAATQTKNSAAC